MVINVPNALSTARILALFPLIVLSFYPRYFLIAFVLFVLTMVSDLLDGYIARRYAQVTRLGKFLDQIADKLVITAILLVFLSKGLSPFWFVALIILRDLVVGGVRMYMSSSGVVVAAKWPGKLKTLLQVIYVGGVYLGPLLSRYAWYGPVLSGIMFLTAFFTVVSLLDYLWDALKHVIGGDNNVV